MLPYWQSPDQHLTLYHGDCHTLLPMCGTVDLIIADAPYFKMKTDAWDQQWPDQKAFLAWVNDIATLLVALLAGNGSLYWFASARMVAQLEILLSQHFCILNSLVWDKGIHRNRANGRGIDVTALRRYWPMTERILFAEHSGVDTQAEANAGYGAACDQLRGVIFEPIRVYLKDAFAALGWNANDLNRICGTANMAGRHYIARSQWRLPTAEHYAALQAAAEGTLREYETLRQEYETLRQEYETLRQEYETLRQEYETLRRPFHATATHTFGDVWRFAVEGRQQHPTQKPLAMLCYMVEISSRPGQMVLDPFAGSGTTGVACALLGRRFIGIEQEERYCAIAARRLQQTIDAPLLPLGK